jgi:hypothetical protein
MKRDPIVEEIHQIRQKLLDECEGDLEKLMDRLKAAERQDHGRMVSLELFREHPQREHARH